MTSTVNDAKNNAFQSSDETGVFVCCVYVSMGASLGSEIKRVFLTKRMSRLLDLDLDLVLGESVRGAEKKKKKGGGGWGDKTVHVQNWVT